MPTSESAFRKDQRNANNATFEHRHFAKVAAIIAELGVTPEVRHEIALEFAASLASTNPRFNRSRFMRACGEAA